MYFNSEVFETKEIMYYHSGLRYQRGTGIGSIFSGLFRMLKPLASMGLSAGKRLLGSSLAKQAGSKMLDIGKNAATNLLVDVLEGAPIKESAEKQLEEAKTKIASAIKGGGKKRKRKKQCGGSNKKQDCKKIAYSLIDDD